MSEYDVRSVPETSPAPRPEPFPDAEDPAAIPAHGRIVTVGAGAAPATVGRPATHDDVAGTLPEPPPEVAEAARGLPDRWLSVPDAAWKGSGTPPDWAVPGRWRTDATGPAGRVADETAATAASAAAPGVDTHAAGAEDGSGRADVPETPHAPQEAEPAGGRGLRE
ncbi:hypothetical protein [Streptomyces sp. NPDC058735]|uniref:hypothetical protein n=1 Tax=unclassified Streptomyces TaxID=2593676 RepID=UPI003678A252